MKAQRLRAAAAAASRPDRAHSPEDRSQIDDGETDRTLDRPDTFRQYEVKLTSGDLAKCGEI